MVCVHIGYERGLCFDISDIYMRFIISGGLALGKCGKYWGGGIWKMEITHMWLRSDWGLISDFLS